MIPSIFPIPSAARLVLKSYDPLVVRSMLCRFNTIDTIITVRAPLADQFQFLARHIIRPLLDCYSSSFYMVRPLIPVSTCSLILGVRPLLPVPSSNSNSWRGTSTCSRSTGASTHLWRGTKRYTSELQENKQKISVVQRLTSKQAVNSDITPHCFQSRERRAKHCCFIPSTNGI